MKISGSSNNSDINRRILPRGFPSILSHPLAWNPDELEKSAYRVQLSNSELSEIDLALSWFKGLGVDGGRVSRENFPLPSLGPKLQKLATQIHDGIGFLVLRGIPLKIHSPGDAIVIYLGIAAHIGDRRGCQDSRGNVLTHVENFTNMSVPAEKRHGIHSNTSIQFHTDVIADIVGQLVFQSAARGGELILAPLWTVYNELATQRPDVIKTLALPNWPSQEIRGSGQNLRPVLFFEEGKIICSLDPSPWNAEGTQNDSNLSPKQSEALRVLQFCARKYSLAVKLQAGDLVFVNNLALLHARSAFKDSDTQKRHTVRMGLRNDQLGWKIPYQLHNSWESVFGVPEKEHRFLVEPKPYVRMPKIALNTACVDLIRDEEV